MDTDNLAGRPVRLFEASTTQLWLDGDSVASCAQQSCPATRHPIWEPREPHSCPVTLLGGQPPSSHHSRKRAFPDFEPESEAYRTVIPEDLSLGLGGLQFDTEPDLDFRSGCPVSLVKFKSYLREGGAVVGFPPPFQPDPQPPPPDVDCGQCVRGGFVTSKPASADVVRALEAGDVLGAHTHQPLTHQPPQLPWQPSSHPQQQGQPVYSILSQPGQSYHPLEQHHASLHQQQQYQRHMQQYPMPQGMFHAGPQQQPYPTHPQNPQPQQFHHAQQHQPQPQQYQQEPLQQQLAWQGAVDPMGAMQLGGGESLSGPYIRPLRISRVDVRRIGPSSNTTSVGNSSQPHLPLSTLTPRTLGSDVLSADRSRSVPYSSLLDRDVLSPAPQSAAAYPTMGYDVPGWGVPPDLELEVTGLQQQPQPQRQRTPVYGAQTAGVPLPQLLQQPQHLHLQQQQQAPLGAVKGESLMPLRPTLPSQRPPQQGVLPHGGSLDLQHQLLGGAGSGGCAEASSTTGSVSGGGGGRRRYGSLLGPVGVTPAPEPSGSAAAATLGAETPGMAVAAVDALMRNVSFAPAGRNAHEAGVEGDAERAGAHHPASHATVAAHPTAAGRRPVLHPPLQPPQQQEAEQAGMGAAAALLGPSGGARGTAGAGSASRSSDVNGGWTGFEAEDEEGLEDGGVGECPHQSRASGTDSRAAANEGADASSPPTRSVPLPSAGTSTNPITASTTHQRPASGSIGTPPRPASALSGAAAGAASSAPQPQPQPGTTRKAAQRSAAAAAAREAAGATKAGKPRQRTRMVSTLADAIRLQLLTPGSQELLVGNQDLVKVNIHSDGRIESPLGEFPSLSSFALAVLRQRNPNRMACDGWQEVKLNGVRMDEVRKEAARLLGSEPRSAGPKTKQ